MARHRFRGLLLRPSDELRHFRMRFQLRKRVERTGELFFRPHRVDFCVAKPVQHVAHRPALRLWHQVVLVQRRTRDHHSPAQRAKTVVGPNGRPREAFRFRRTFAVAASTLRATHRSPPVYLTRRSAGTGRQ